MNATFCDLTTFATAYASIHGPLSFIVCLFGSIANILNVCILTTKAMRWPTNLILTGLALADLLVMLDYMPYTLHRYMSRSPRHYTDYSYNWALFMLFHALFSQALHFVSCCLTVVLAVWRYVALTSPDGGRGRCGMRRTSLAVAAAYVVCPLVCTPLFVSLRIADRNQTCDEDGRMLDRKQVEHYHGVLVKQLIYYVRPDDGHYKTLSFWVYGVVIKLVPCILLTHLSCRLIGVLLETKRRRRLLLDANRRMQGSANGARKLERCKQADRTTGMLLAVLMLFLITEFPQAILGLLSAILGEKFERQCYIPLGDLMDILALTNSAINFILYCTMSRQFRSTFSEVFRLDVLYQKMPLVVTHSAYDRNGEKTQLTQV